MAKINVRKTTAVALAQNRRQQHASRRATQWQWFIDEFLAHTTLTVEKRMQLAVAFLRDETVRNISRPVTKTYVRTLVKDSTGVRRPKQRTIVTNRSKPGEFPKADTTQLMKTLFSDVLVRKGIVTGFVGTPLYYGVILELRLRRKFLSRTLLENRDKISKFFVGAIE